MAKLKDGFYKQTASSIGSDLLVLLAGGGAKPISDFATTTDLSGYLPLTGGTLIGVDPILTLNCTDASPRIVFKQNGTTKGSIRFNDNNQLSVLPKNSPTWYEFLHTGNYSSYALPKDGNAVSATKLQTARTIWGQSFDGTGNVNGILTLNYNSSTSGIELTREGSNESSIAFNNGYGRSVIGSWGGGTHLWIQGLGNILTANMTTGNVGIGTTNPSYKLQVEGYFYCHGSDSIGRVNIYNRSQTYPTSVTRDACNLLLGGHLSAKNGYNTGIGFNALYNYNYSTYGSHLHAWIGLSPCINSAWAELYDLVIATNSSTTTNTAPLERVRITYDGCLLIGRKVSARKATWLKLVTPGHTGSSAWCIGVDDTTDNSYLYFKYADADSLACYVRHDGCMFSPHFYESSDQRLKENIQAIINKDNIPQIKEFDWKENGSHSYGLIAQELEEQGYSELVSTKNDGYKTVNYSAALSLIVGKLQVKIKELEKEIENLKNKN